MKRAREIELHALRAVRKKELRIGRSPAGNILLGGADGLPAEDGPPKGSRHVRQSPQVRERVRDWRRAREMPCDDAAERRVPRQILFGRALGDQHVRRHKRGKFVQQREAVLFQSGILRSVVRLVRYLNQRDGVVAGSDLTQRPHVSAIIERPIRRARQRDEMQVHSARPRQFDQARQCADAVLWRQIEPATERRQNAHDIESGLVRPIEKRHGVSFPTVRHTLEELKPSHALPGEMFARRQDQRGAVRADPPVRFCGPDGRRRDQQGDDDQQRTRHRFQIGRE